MASTDRSDTTRASSGRRQLYKSRRIADMLPALWPDRLAIRGMSVEQFCAPYRGCGPAGLRSVPEDGRQPTAAGGATSPLVQRCRNHALTVRRSCNRFDARIGGACPISASASGGIRRRMEFEADLRGNDAGRPLAASTGVHGKHSRPNPGEPYREGSKVCEAGEPISIRHRSLVGTHHGEQLHADGAR